MNKKFEIKAHDGAGRLGKLEDIETPNIINIDLFKVAYDEGVAYNIEKEIATFSVNRTIQKAKDFNGEIATIQGSKYIDLRLKCLKELEELGYSGFIIANGDDLLLRPRDLVDLVINLRENMKPGSYLIFPMAECSFIPILSYLGIDGFLDDIGEYYSYLNVMMTPTKNYDLNVYEIYEMNQEDLLTCNKSTIDFVLREVREHMKNGTLRNLVEERAATSPQNMSLLKILDKEYQDYLQKYTQLY
ncbi:MAG: archaeosine tRNA-ribosyltransferase [Methanobrevibacter sp.]|nr:archaeosine tRNA-ribosyltransferase [Methanobrevibacter sp.]